MTFSKLNLSLSLIAIPAMFALPAQAATYSATAIVASSGGDYTNPAAALTDVSTWCGTASDSNRCLIKIMPGNYAVASSLVMQQWVDMAGSGKHSTVLEGTGNGASVVAIAENSELADLTVRAGGVYTSGLRIGVGFASNSVNSAMRRVRVETNNNANEVRGVSYYRGAPTIENVEVACSGNGWSTGIRGAYGDPKLNNVTVTMTGPSVNIGFETRSGVPVIKNSGFFASGGTSNEGMRLMQSKALVVDVEARGDGGTKKGTGILNTGGGNSSPSLLRVRAIGTGSGGGYGVYNNAGSSTSRIDNSWLHGTTNGVTTNGGHVTLISNSKIAGGVNTISGTTTCAFVVDNATYTAYASTCP